MKTIRAIVIIATLAILGGCYPGISGKVVDGMSGSPIPEAVVLAQWTTTGGLPGLSNHSVYKITETETDKEGHFSISGVYNPFVDPPELVIYKKGYVPWRNDMDFMDPRWSQYDKNIWQNNLTYNLMLLPVGYSKTRLAGFVSTGLMRVGPKFEKIQSEANKEALKEVNW